MSKSLISKFILPVILLGLSISNASAALQCGTQPSCADLGYSKASVSGCTDVIYCPFDTSYKKCVTPKSADDKCGAYGLNSCPDNADCDYCATAYKIVGCDSGYTLTNNTCVCATSCANKISQSSIPANATATTQSCTACGVTSNIIIGWKCNTGYTQINGRCELANTSCESAGYLSEAVTNANCDSHTIYLTNGTQKTCYSNCTCNEGFELSGNTCETTISPCDAAGYFKCIPQGAVSTSCIPVSIDSDNGIMLCYKDCMDSNGLLLASWKYEC